MLLKREQQGKLLVVDALIKKIEDTYSDFIQNEEGFDGLSYFFRHHIYAPKNKEKRDKVLENLYRKLKAITGPQMTKRVHQLILLNQFTDRIDIELTRVLLAGPWKGKEDLTDVDLSIKELEWAICEAGQCENREEQIEMLCEALGFFFSLSRMPMVRLVIAPIKVAAMMVGAEDLVETMEAGYKLSQKIKNIEFFIEAFRTREKKNLQTIVSLYT